MRHVMNNADKGRKLAGQKLKPKRLDFNNFLIGFEHSEFEHN